MLVGLTRKVTFAAVVFLILIALVLAFVLVSMTTLQETTSHLNDELIPQLDAKGDFNTSLARAVGELEAFLGSHDEGELQEAQEAFTEAQDALASLTALRVVDDAQDGPEERAAGHRLLEHQTAILATMQRLLADAASSGAELQPQIDQLHAELAAVEEESDKVTEDHRTAISGELATGVRAVYAGAIAFGVLCIGLTLLALLMLRRTIVQPVVALAHSAEQVAAGELEQSVPATGPDEIGALQRAFSAMVGTLGQQTQQLQQQVAALSDQLRMIDQQRTVIGELSVPILPLSDDALVMPLVGAMDMERLQVVQQRALRAVGESRTRYALLDVTGVPFIDSRVAQGLLEIIQGVRLLGAEVVVVGIRAEVAQSIVGLGLQLDDVTVRSTLQDGIQYTLSRG